MKKKVDLRKSYIAPINILRIIKVFNGLKEGDVLEVRIKDESTIESLYKFFENGHLKIVKDKKGFFIAILKK